MVTRKALDCQGASARGCRRGGTTAAKSLTEAYSFGVGASGRAVFRPLRRHHGTSAQVKDCAGGEPVVPPVLVLAVVVDGDLAVAENLKPFAPDENRGPLVYPYAEEFRVRVN